MTIPPSVVTPDQPDTQEWENEGGAGKPKPPGPLPEGIIAVELTHYRVGKYSYSKLEDALAQHKRQAIAPKA